MAFELKQSDLDKVNSIVNQLYLEGDPIRVEHLQLAGTYAERLIAMFPFLAQEDIDAIRFAAVSHDLLKGKTFDNTAPELEIDGHVIDQDLERYVRSHIDQLKAFDLDTYINTDVQLHALASGIFVMTELGITEPKAIWPIFFHSCPILPIYEKLSKSDQLNIDIVVLADKLSSNRLKVDLGKRTSLDLGLAVYGEDGLEFNYTMGVYLARLIGQGKSPDTHSKTMTEHYYQRVVKMNPVMGMIEQPIILKKPKKVKEKTEVTSDGKEKGDNPGNSDQPVAGDDAASVTD